MWPHYPSVFPTAIVEVNARMFGLSFNHDLIRLNIRNKPALFIPCGWSENLRGMVVGLSAERQTYQTRKMGQQAYTAKTPQEKVLRAAEESFV